MIIQRILFTALLATAIAATHIYDVSAAEKKPAPAKTAGKSRSLPDPVAKVNNIPITAADLQKAFTAYKTPLRVLQYRQTRNVTHNCLC